MLSGLLSTTAATPKIAAAGFRYSREFFSNQASGDYCDTTKGRQMIQWKAVGEYVEPNWVKLGTDLPPILFWRPVKGAVLGFLRDGELFDAKWIYVCDANKVSHFAAVNIPVTSS